MAYYGSPLKAPDIFIKAINESGSPSRDLLQKTLGQASNKADLIMDMLKDVSIGYHWLPWLPWLP